MNIVIDVRPLMGGKLTGVEIYTRSLLEQLFKLDQKNHYILFANMHGAKHKAAPGLNFPKFKQPNVTFIQTKIPNKILNLTLSFLKWPKLDLLILNYLKKHPTKQPKNFDGSKGINIFFLPDIRPTALSKRVKKITVVHDLSFQHFPHFFSAKTRLWYTLLNPQKEIKESTKIIAVSEFTKADLEKTWHIPAQKIEVIHEGVDENFGLNISKEKIENIKRKYQLPDQYFLSLSTLEPRKNLVRLLEAFKLFKERLKQSQDPSSNLKLVLAGIKNHKIFSKMELKNIPDVVMTGFIEEEDKAIIYAQAKAFIYVSLFEGFGLPLVEAMKCQTPIIVSNRSAMPEVVGEAALFINPENVKDIEAAMVKIQDNEVQEKLKKAMVEQVKKFSWEKCAEKTLQLF